MEINTNYLFVYGTLKKTFSNPFLNKLRECINFYNNGWVYGDLYKIDNYPGLKLNNNGNKVYGEIYFLKNVKKAIKIIDEYEGVGEGYYQPNEYIKKVIDVKTSSGIIQCLTYLYNWSIEGKTKINSGIFN
ncbi:gamma-glutamylcyclotransferase [Bacteroidota bacterium]